MLTKTLHSPHMVQHKQLVAWVDKMAALCKPDQVYWCNGSQAEYDRLCEEMVTSGTFIKLNQEPLDRYSEAETSAEVVRIQMDYVPPDREERPSPA